MDARALRTAASLREAVLRLAARRPIDDITAVELVAEAGVTRRTLYNHTSSPQQLLVDVLRPELDAIADTFRTRLAAGMARGDAWEAGDRELAQHLLRWIDIYGAGVTGPADHLSPSLAHMLSDSFEQGVLELTAGASAGQPDPLITARFIGHGIVGAIEAWLLDPHREPDDLVAGILRSVPTWMSWFPEGRPQ